VNASTGWTRIEANISPFQRVETPEFKGLSCYELHQKRDADAKGHNRDICTHNNCICRQNNQECEGSCPCACSQSVTGKTYNNNVAYMNSATCVNRRTTPAAVDVVSIQNKYWGLSTLQDLNSNQFIIEYTGRVVDSKEV
jgi:hypothetical protein